MPHKLPDVSPIGARDALWASLAADLADWEPEQAKRDAVREAERLAALASSPTRLGEPPASNTGATSDRKSYADLFGWDWSQTTHEARGTDMTTVELTAQMVQALVRGAGVGAGAVDGGPGLQGWGESVAVYDGEGFAVGRVYFGGRTDVHVQATSSAAQVVRPLVACLHGAKTSRVDTRVDSLVPFDDLAQILREAADMYGSEIRRVESEVRGESRGRTIYLGSPTSRIRVRLYEKWLESPGQYVEGTNRVEVQLRPDSRAKAVVSHWEPVETFCASRTTKRLAEQLVPAALPQRSVQSGRRGTPDLERTLSAMGDQYSRAVDRWLRYSGGDVGRVLDHLGLSSGDGAAAGAALGLL